MLITKNRDVKWSSTACCHVVYVISDAGEDSEEDLRSELVFLEPRAQHLSTIEGMNGEHKYGTEQDILLILSTK